MTPVSRDPGRTGAPSPPVDPVVRPLRDGRLVRLRPVAPDDRPRIASFLAQVSTESLERRYFSATARDRVAGEIVAVPSPAQRVSLLAELVDVPERPVVAHGEFDRDGADPSRAEVAFLVADAWHGHGVATVLLHRLAEIARDRGIRWFEAVVRSENPPMVDVFLGAGFPCSVEWHWGEGSVRLEIGAPPTASRAVAVAVPGG